MNKHELVVKVNQVRIKLVQEFLKVDPDCKHLMVVFSLNPKQEDGSIPNRYFHLRKNCITES